MKAIAVFTALLTILTGQTTAPTLAVYVVARPAGAEGRAMLSARLVKLNGTNLHWYDGAAVLRLDLPKDTLTAARQDPDVILVLPDGEPETPPLQPPAPPALPLPSSPVAPPIATPIAMPPAGMNMPGIGPGMAPTMGMPMAPGMMPGAGAFGMVDSLAGMVLTRMMNPTPSCHISVSAPSANFGLEGGEQVILVKASGSCAWQAQASVPWIRITSGSGVAGSGIVSYSVSSADGKPRAGSISIVGAPGGSQMKGNATVVVMQSK